MTKKTKRKAFSFLRSYFDVINELEKDSDKLDFLLAILNKQFLNEDPSKLKFVPKLCYESQRHAIEASVKGWLRASKTDLQGNPLTLPTTPLGTNPLTLPKEEKEEEKEKEEKYTIDFLKLLDFINAKTKRGFRTINKATQKKYLARLKEGYTSQDIKIAIENAVKSKNHIENQNKYLTPEFFSRADKLNMYSATTKPKNLKPNKPSF